MLRESLLQYEVFASHVPKCMLMAVEQAELSGPLELLFQQLSYELVVRPSLSGRQQQNVVQSQLQ